MKKYSFWKKIRYNFDRYIQKGVSSRIFLLFWVFVVSVVILGALSKFTDAEDGVLTLMWQTFLHVLDPGTLAGDSAEVFKVSYIIMMTCATILGLVITSCMVGIVSTYIDEYLKKLQNSKSRVMLKDHTLILGFNNNVYTLIDEICKANSNHTKRKHPWSLKRGRRYIVVADDYEQTAMSEMIREQALEFRGTDVIFRSGELVKEKLYERCALEDCKTVIINNYDDAEVIKILLSLNNFISRIEKKEKRKLKVRIIAAINQIENMEVAKMAAGEKGIVISFDDAISRIIAHTCQQPGLSRLFAEIFNFDGYELYFEKIEKKGPLKFLIGKTFLDAVLAFSCEVPIGLFRDGVTWLNPPFHEEIYEGDSVILFEEDDGSYVKNNPRLRTLKENLRESKLEYKEASKDLLILGCNHRIEMILKEYARCMQGSHVIIATAGKEDQRFWKGNGFEVEHTVMDIMQYQNIKQLIAAHGINNILLLSNSGKDKQAADAETIMQLVFLKKISQELGTELCITCEMQIYENQIIADTIHENDFIVGSRYINLIMAQYSENPELAEVFEEILDVKGSEFYVEPVEKFLELNVEMDFYEVSAIAAKKGCIALGYKKGTQGEKCTIYKDEKVTFEQGDKLIVLEKGKGKTL